MKVTGAITTTNVSGSISGGVIGDIVTSDVSGAITGNVSGAVSQLDVTGAVTEEGIAHLPKYVGILKAEKSLYGGIIGWYVSEDEGDLGSISPYPVVVNMVTITAITFDSYSYEKRVRISPNPNAILLTLNGVSYNLLPNGTVLGDNLLEEGREYTITII